MSPTRMIDVLVITIEINSSELKGFWWIQDV